LVRLLSIVCVSVCLKYNGFVYMNGLPTIKVCMCPIHTTDYNVAWKNSK
jgi:hypothetical protein